MLIGESGEMYLTTILLLSEKNGKVRSLDIANHMGFSRPSVSRAIKILREEHYIHVSGMGFITLTERGMEIAKKIRERHEVIRDFFISRGVDEATADKDACRIEHIISEEGLKALKNSLSE
ncbi:iron (metal) dependent repressor, DtxR family [Ruminococcaceae bacterium YRB3002]|nr:iron (metal) dependent repressor, DtxR family [Ruminococcaceae bacterium YRB3002]